MSMPEIRFEVATRSHILELRERLRAGDAAEVEAAGMSAATALWRSFRIASFARAAVVDGEVAAMWGMGGGPFARIGRPWLLTAPPVERIRKTLIREGRAQVQLMLAICPELRGYVDSRYGGAIRFLEATGFSISREFPFGVHRMPFREFQIRRA